jgi:hypothetical protein
VIVLSKTLTDTIAESVAVFSNERRGVEHEFYIKRQ